MFFERSLCRLWHSNVRRAVHKTVFCRADWRCCFVQIQSHSGARRCAHLHRLLGVGRCDSTACLLLRPSRLLCPLRVIHSFCRCLGCLVWSSLCSVVFWLSQARAGCAILSFFFFVVLCDLLSVPLSSGRIKSGFCDALVPWSHSFVSRVSIIFLYSWLKTDSNLP